jgi:hypothetical protein
MTDTYVYMHQKHRTWDPDIAFRQCQLLLGLYPRPLNGYCLFYSREAHCKLSGAKRTNALRKMRLDYDFFPGTYGLGLVVFKISDGFLAFPHTSAGL